MKILMLEFISWGLVISAVPLYAMRSADQAISFWDRFNSWQGWVGFLLILISFQARENIGRIKERRIHYKYHPKGLKDAEK